MEPNSLDRFVKAQERVYFSALSEISGGKKRSHWMWFVFPQLRGLGLSETAHYYGIASLSEASEYLAHELLERLVEISEALLGVEGKTAAAIFGSPDDLKLHSSMTLFSQVKGCDEVFGQVLQKYFRGVADQRTLEILQKQRV